MKKISLIILVAISICLLISCGQSPKKAEVYYFYENVCGSCNPEADFFELVNDRMAGVKLPETHKTTMVNTFSSGTTLYDEQMERLQIPKEKQSLPLLIVGNNYVSGEDAVKQNLRWMLCDYYDIEDNKTFWYYFRPNCKDCTRIEDFVAETKKSHPEVSWIDVDVMEEEPKAAFKANLSEWKVPEDKWQVPFLWNGTTYLSGDVEIEEKLDGFLSGE